jgi:hypothetical protein
MTERECFVIRQITRKDAASEVVAMSSNRTVTTTSTYYVGSGLGSDPEDGFRALKQLIKQQGGSTEDAQTEAADVVQQAMV